jgi:hypothetical protein
VSAMREAFERWWNASKYMQVVISSEGAKQCAFDGWQACLEHIKDGGPSAYQHPDGDCGTSPHHLCTPLYKLSEDK